MRKEILVVGFACLSLIAAAQSNGTSGQSSNASKSVAPRDSSSGHASGKSAPAGKSTDREGSTPSVSEVVVTKPSGNKTRVATGDVNGDGTSDVAATGGSGSGNGQNAAINTSHSNIKSPRDAASGHASGKRQHEPVQIKKTVDAASPKL
jgi:Type VI secretion system effector, Hcp